MDHLTEHLHRHAERIRRRSRAEVASVYLHAPWLASPEPVLLHAGQGAPITELSTLARAASFHRAHTQQPSGSATAAAWVVTGTEPRTVLLPVPDTDRLPAVPDDSTRPATDSRIDPVGWIGLRFGDDQSLAVAGSPATRTDTLDLACALAEAFVALHTVGSDPLTGLPGRAHLLGIVRRDLRQAHERRRPCSLLLINPDEFERLNDRFGRPGGDLVLRDVVVCLQRALRAGDALVRYGAAVFAVPLPNTGSSQAVALAEKARRALTDRTYLEGRVGLAFSVGAATWEPDEPAPDVHELIRRANVALGSAKRDGGGRSATWSSDADDDPSTSLDRLGGIFTGDQNRDYRNLALLWDAMNGAWSGETAAEVAGRFADQLITAMRPTFVGIYESSGSMAAIVERREPGDTSAEPVTPVTTPQDMRLVADVCASGVARHERVGDDVVLAVAARASGRVVAGVLLRGRAARLRADASDLTFLEGLAAGAALAIDRARLLALDRDREQRERCRLASELGELRSVLREVRLVYASPAVERVVSDARRVANTDATVLLTGESGTGKGLLALTIHKVSGRRNRPFVVVDCSAIPPNLAESELFGHERGAFTGAVARNPGRVVQADGGTLLLDEVGELPLDVQAKLLRLVEEHVLTPVGSHTTRRVDVRVLAATNRDLAREVAARRFRLDLFHRLSVVPLELPPLRDRDEDVLMLARHFLEGFAAKYQKPPLRISDDLERRMLTYPWPGNVRELQNRLLRAVLLADGDTLSSEHVPIVDDGPLSAIDAPLARPSRAPSAGAIAPMAIVRDDDAPAAPRETLGADSERRAADAGTSLATLRETLVAAVNAVADLPLRARPPLGRWLADEIVLAGLAEAHGVARRAAALLNVAETTYTRRLDRARRDAGHVSRPSYWQAVSAVVATFVRHHRSGAGERSTLDVAEAVLLDAIERRFPRDARAGAALLGTTVVTFRRRVTPLPLAV